MTGNSKNLLKRLGAVSSMDETREQLAALVNPSYLIDMREQMAVMLNSLE